MVSLSKMHCGIPSFSFACFLSVMSHNSVSDAEDGDSRANCSVELRGTVFNS